MYIVITICRDIWNLHRWVLNLPFVFRSYNIYKKNNKAGLSVIFLGTHQNLILHGSLHMHAICIFTYSGYSSFPLMRPPPHERPHTLSNQISEVGVSVMEFNATFNNISVISWQSVLLVEETGVSGENLWPAASHNVVSSTPGLSVIQTHNGRCWLHR